MHFWGDAVLTATHRINRVPTKVLKNKSPYRVLYQKQPSFDYFRVFGCLCFVSTLSHNRKKFDSRANKCVFIGYPNYNKRYKFYDLEAQKVKISRNIVFHENIFPFKDIQHDTQHSEFCQTPDVHADHIDDFDFDQSNFLDHELILTKLPENEPTPCPENVSTPIQNGHDSLPVNDMELEEIETKNTIDHFNLIQPFRKSSRHKRAPKYLDAYYTKLPSQSNFVTMHPIFD